MNRQQFAQAVKNAVDRACKAGTPVSPGARIEEILRAPLPAYPDEIMPLDLLPSIDGLKFIGWTADFQPVEMEQAAVFTEGGKPVCIQVTNDGEPDVDYIVGWKPVRPKPLEKSICAPVSKKWEAERRRALREGPFFW